MSRPLRVNHDQCIGLIKRKSLSIYSSSYTSQTRFPDGRSHHTSKVHVCSIRFIFTIAHTHIIRSQEQTSRSFFDQASHRTRAPWSSPRAKRAYVCRTTSWALYMFWLGGGGRGRAGGGGKNCAGHLAERCKTQSITPSWSNCIKSASKE